VAVKDRLAGVPVLGTALQVQERYKQDAADQLAAAIGFFGFLSLFPLMILAVAAAGFVLTDPAEQARVATLITESIPGFEATLGDDDTAVSQLVSNVVANRGAIGIVGLVTLLLTGLRVVNSAMTASTVVFRAQVPTGIKAKLWQVLVMVVLGVLALAAVVASTLAGAPADLLPRWAALLLALGVSFGLDTLLFLAAYRLLRGDARVGARDLLPGALLAAVGWTALKVAGATYVGNQVEGANALYGALGGVIALLLLFYLAGRLYLYGAQLSAVLLERRAGPLADLEEPLDRSAGTDGPGPGTDEPGPGTDGPGPGTDEPGSGGGEPGPEAGGSSVETATSRPHEVGAAATGAPEADPGPTRLPPQIGSPAVGADTRRRLEHAEATRPRGADIKGAAGFVLGAAALAAAWRLLRDE
jgi:membrane protein